MIITELQGNGRLGNALFQIAIGLYISNQLNTELYIKISDDIVKNYYENEIFPYEFFRNFNYLPMQFNTNNFKIISDTKFYKTYEEFPLENNIIIAGWFLGKNYIHYDTIKDIFKPSKELTEEIFDLYNPTRNSLMINIRRGDFLDQNNINSGWYSAPKKYWESTYKFLNKTYDKVFITSDDTEWCKNNLDFCDNIIIVDKPVKNSKIFFDLFLPTFVGDNIISASTFGWWGAYLNQNPYKQIIMPYPWNTLRNNWRNNAYYLNNCIKFDIYKYINII